jgi:tetratricopeptide (TPR) repeat protein
MAVPSEDLGEKFRQALALHQQGQIVSAEVLYKDILAIQPGHVDALHMLGVAAGQRGEVRTSLELLNQVIAQEPNRAAAYSDRGIGLHSLGRLDEALTSFDQALALQPDFPVALNCRSIVLRDLGILEEDERRHLEQLKHLLAAVPFQNPDIGPLNDLADVDCFVLSMPKCGTSALQRGLESAGRKVIHTHTDPSTCAAYPNGWILKDGNFGIEQFLRLRLQEKTDPIHIFFGYREPVSWYLSIVGQFHLPLTYKLRQEIPDKLKYAFPWNYYRIGDTAYSIRRATGIDPGKQQFDGTAGFSVIREGRVNLVLFRFDRLANVADYITRHVEKDFVLRYERVNEDARYIAYRKSFTLPETTLRALYADKWCRMFYSDAERDELVRKYSDGAVGQ